MRDLGRLLRAKKVSSTELTKLFRWLEADDLEGVENWQTLTMDQAARTIGFLTKKLTEKETA